jgi:hypothetical protein
MINRDRLRPVVTRHERSARDADTTGDGAVLVAVGATWKVGFILRRSLGQFILRSSLGQPVRFLFHNEHHALSCAWHGNISKLQHTHTNSAGSQDSADELLVRRFHR